MVTQVQLTPLIMKFVLSSNVLETDTAKKNFQPTRSKAVAISFTTFQY